MTHGITDDDLEMIRTALEKDSTFAQQHSTSHGSKQPIFERDCEQARKEALNGKTSHELASQFNCDDNTIRKHIKGECDHDPDIGALTFVGNWQSGGEWVKDG